MADLLESFRAVVAALDEARVPFAVPSLVAAVNPLGFVRREREPSRLAGCAITMHGLTRVLAGDPDVLVLDVVEVGSGATAEAWAGRETAQWEGRPVTVVSRGGLVALKRLRSSPQDQADIAALGEP